MSRRYVFFVNAAYCYEIYRPVQSEIIARGGEVAWFFAKGIQPALAENEMLLASERSVKDFLPDVIFGAGDWIPYYLPGLKVMLFHGLAINKRADINNAHYKIRGWYDLYCTHAQQDTRRFSELAAEHQNFLVKKTGWPKLDSLLARRRESLDKKKQSQFTLFFASTFSPSITAAPAVVDFLEELSRNGRCKVLATLHPLMDKGIVARYQAIKNENFIYLPPESDIFSAMAESDVMLCDTSSIMYEYMFLNRPVVTFRTKNPGPFVRDVHQVRDLLPAFEEVLEDASAQLQAAGDVCRELHEFLDGKSSGRVLDAVDQVLDAGLKELKKKPINILRKIKLRKRLGYWGW